MLGGFFSFNSALTIFKTMELYGTFFGINVRELIILSLFKIKSVIYFSDESMELKYSLIRKVSKTYSLNWLYKLLLYDIQDQKRKVGVKELPED